MTSPRQALANALTPLLPTGWKIVRSIRPLDVLSKPVVILKQERFSRLETAPEGVHLVAFTITVVSPLEDLEKAEDQLDDLTNAVIHALDDSGIRWTEAKKVMYNDVLLAYDITVELTSTKE